MEAPAQCGKLEVLENRSAPEGRRISLKVVVLPATEGKRQPDPVFILAGGPDRRRATTPISLRASWRVFGGTAISCSSTSVAPASRTR
jgi:hypothetical protein